MNGQGMDAGGPAGGLCGCLVDCAQEEFSGYLNHLGIDLLEWRIDAFAGRFPEDRMNRFFKTLGLSSRHPVVATNRPAREAGLFDGPEDLRLRMLEKAAKSGAEWVDLEHDVPAEYVTDFRRHDSRILLSYHNPAETPSRRALRAKLEKMCRSEADALKIATFARSEEDNLHVLQLIPLARREFGMELVAFCMGPAGRWSRLACLLLGSPWTYVRLGSQPAAAPGQFTAEEMRLLLKIVNQT